MLEIHTDLMIFTAIVFLALIYLLNTMLYKPMLKFMDDRENSIKSSEKSIASTAGDLSSTEAEIEAVLLKAREEAARIKSDALNLAKAEADKQIAAKRVELEAKYSEFNAQLAIKRAELKSSLESQAPEFKSALLSKLAKI